jgi:mRNA interferase MazF
MTREIRQGDVFWTNFGPAHGSKTAWARLCVVVQNDLFNHSRINTVVVCALTSNLRRARAPGNVLLEADEGGLVKQSVVMVSQIYTIDKQDLAEKIGWLSKKRIYQIFEGVKLLTEPI